MSGKKNAKLRLFGVLNHRRLRGSVSMRKVKVVFPDPRGPQRPESVVRPIANLVSQD